MADEDLMRQVLPLALVRMRVVARTGLLYLDPMYEALLVLTLALNLSSDLIDRRVSRSSRIDALSLWTGIVQLLLICPFLGLVDVPTLPQLAVLAVVGWFSAYARGRWYAALSDQTQRLSRFTPFLRMSSVLVLLFAVLVLGERLTDQMALGAVLMIGAGFIVSLDKAHTSIREFFTANRALGMVLVFALSNALISVAYKHLLNLGVSIISIYFFLKLFQCAPLIAQGWRNNTLAYSYDEITNLRLFVASRALQTVAALVFLLALSKLDLSRVEPIVALMPLAYVVWEWYERRRGLPGATPSPSRRTVVIQLVALALSIVGFLLLR